MAIMNTMMAIMNAKMVIMKSKKGVINTLVVAGFKAPACWILFMIHSGVLIANHLTFNCT